MIVVGAASSAFRGKMARGPCGLGSASDTAASFPLNRTACKASARGTVCARFAAARARASASASLRTWCWRSAKATFLGDGTGRSLDPDARAMRSEASRRARASRQPDARATAWAALSRASLSCRSARDRGASLRLGWTRSAAAMHRLANRLPQNSPSITPKATAASASVEVNRAPHDCNITRAASTVSTGPLQSRSHRSRTVSSSNTLATSRTARRPAAVSMTSGPEGDGGSRREIAEWSSGRA